MGTTLVTAAATIFVGVLSLIGVIITNNNSNKKMQNDMKIQQALTDEKISQLTREVREHNNFAKRMPVVEAEINRINGRIKELEGLHKREG